MATVTRHRPPQLARPATSSSSVRGSPDSYQQRLFRRVIHGGTGTMVLAEFATVTGSIGAVALRVVERLPASSDSSSPRIITSSTGRWHHLSLHGHRHLRKAVLTFAIVLLLYITMAACCGASLFRSNI